MGKFIIKLRSRSSEVQVRVREVRVRLGEVNRRGQRLEEKKSSVIFAILVVWLNIVFI